MELFSEKIPNSFSEPQILNLSRKSSVPKRLGYPFLEILTVKMKLQGFNVNLLNLLGEFSK